ncbi:hypothetical protein E2320_015785 [Naja naja]|nr:hypothetical protein E2320_015785 [Naja naja]
MLSSSACELLTNIQLTTKQNKKQVKGNFELTKSKWLEYKDECLKRLQESQVSKVNFQKYSLSFPSSQEYIVMEVLISLLAGLIRHQEMYLLLVHLTYRGLKMFLVAFGEITKLQPDSAIISRDYSNYKSSGSARNVYRVCLDQGIWQNIENTTEIWNNRSECLEENHFKVKVSRLIFYGRHVMSDGTHSGKLDYINYVGSFCFQSEDLALFMVLEKLSTVGYSISLVSLVLAFIILLLFRKLHCTRNYIHMNLFASFILRAAGVLIKDSITRSTYKFLSSESEMPADESGWISSLSPEVLQQAVFILSFPVLFVAPWGILKYQLDHNVNFCIFLIILKLLLSKLKAQQMTFRDYKFRLARSTIVLIPLLGIHEIVFSFIMDDHIEGFSRNIKTFIQLTIGSFHGFLVALLYCFYNGEVKAELRKQWSRFLLAYPFVYMPCFLGKNIKHLRKCPNKQHLSNNDPSLEVTQPPKKQAAKVRTCYNMERGPTARHNLRTSVSDSSEEEIANGETIEEALEENEG